MLEETSAVCIFHIFKKQNMYMTCNCKELTREQCISHLDYLKKVDKETSFDDLITNTSFLRLYCSIMSNGSHRFVVVLTGTRILNVKNACTRTKSINDAN